MPSPRTTRPSDTQRWPDSSPDSSNTQPASNTVAGAASTRVEMTPVELSSCQATSKASGASQRR
jgi:hypothetical protein